MRMNDSLKQFTFLCLLAAVPACAQTPNFVSPSFVGTVSNQQFSTANWGNCGSTACAGGAGNSGSFTMTTGIASPSVSGASLQLSFSSPASGNNGLFWMKSGTCDTCKWVRYDLWSYPSPNADNHEYDSFIFNKTYFPSGGTTTGWDAMFGHQCNTVDGHWQYANQTSGWKDGPTCSLSASAWHHLIFYDWYDPADTSCTGGVPCEHFGYIIQDNVMIPWNGITMPATALNATWGATVGCQVQEDSSANATVTAYVDYFSCWVGK